MHEEWGSNNLTGQNYIYLNYTWNPLLQLPEWILPTEIHSSSWSRWIVSTLPVVLQSIRSIPFFKVGFSSKLYVSPQQTHVIKTYHYFLITNGHILLWLIRLEDGQNFSWKKHCTSIWHLKTSALIRTQAQIFLVVGSPTLHTIIIKPHQSSITPTRHAVSHYPEVSCWNVNNSFVALGGFFSANICFIVVACQLRSFHLECYFHEWVLKV